jgi:hypothetical protein
MAQKTTKRLRPDERGRITLGEIAKSVSSYDVEIQPDGKIILTPYIEIPKNEIWLYKNKEALENVLTGIQQAKEGKVKKRKSYAEFAEIDTD